MMTVKEKHKLIERQEKIMQEYEEWELMQTDHSYDEDFCRFCDWKKNVLDEEAEQIRRVLEMGCCE